MTKPFTPNDLIKYIYREMPEEEQELLMQALHSDDSLMQEYLEMLSAVEQLNQVSLIPSEKVVLAIKKMAHSTGLQKV
jgi:ABC-type dipeptide/oligopeptide/nickel transport system permease component